jgi:DNA-binding CsgD family transcriptional regulator
VSPGGAGQTRPVTLIGREPEQDRLAAAAQAARAGRGRIVLICGEPGIGTTALLASLVAQAAGAGARVASGAAEELERRVPFAAITDCLGAGATGRDTAEITALLRGSHRPSGGALAKADAEFLITEAILGLVDGWCAVGAVVLAMDDLQWADPASLLVLHRLGRVAGQLPLLIAATRRSGAGGPDVERLVRSWAARDADQVSLGPLDERSVAVLTGHTIGAQPGPGLLGMITAAAGNPLYVIELARALASGTMGAGAGAMPESLITVVTGRLAGLSDRAREILPVSAVLGPGFTVAELSAVLATPPLDLIGVVQEAVAAEVLTAEADRLVFRHEVIRQALAESLPPSVRNALHLQAGQALAAAGAPVERAAQHLLAAMTLDAPALAWLAGSADRLSVRAPALASDLLCRAVEVADPAGEQAVPLRLALAGALLRAGRFAEAEAAASAGLATSEGLARRAGPGTDGKPATGAAADGGDGADPGGQLRWVLVQASLNQGHVPEALRQAQQALDGGGLSRAGRARFHGLAAQCLHVLSPGGPAPAMQAAEGARAEGMASGDPVAMAYGLQAVAGASRWQGRFARALDLASQAAAALNRAGPIADSQLDPQLIRANCLFDLDRDAEAQEAYTADLRLAERGTGTFFLCLHHLSVARMCFLTGRWDDALSEISTARDAPDHLGVSVHLDGLATLVAVHRQDRDELATLRAALESPLATGTVRHTIDDRSWGRALALLADGDRDAAFGTLSRAWQECVTGNREYCGHYLLPDLAALAVPLGEAAAARQAVAALDRYLAGRDISSLHRSARFATAILDGDPDALLGVAAAYAAAGRPLLESQAREHAADLLAAAGRASEARIQLDAAQDCYARLDAVWDAARADARLRAHGIRRGAHGPRRRPKSGWAALTDTERKVAALLAEGLSNPDIAARMFTSRRTVQYHVSNILAKLGLSSRVELATLVTRRAG